MKQPVHVRNIQIGDGVPKICIPIVENTSDSILTAAKNVMTACPDIIEWRWEHFDKAEDPESAHEVLGDIPVLFTFRTAKEGGAKSISPASYQQLNCQVAESGLADLIDVEIFTGDDTVRSILDTAHHAGIPVVASSHNFQSTPTQEEILSILEKMDLMGADILKIAVMPQSRKDVVTLLSATGPPHHPPSHYYVHGAAWHDQPPVRGSFWLFFNLRVSRQNFCTGSGRCKRAG